MKQKNRVLNISPELKFRKIRRVCENQMEHNLHSIDKKCNIQKDKLDNSIKLVKKQLENLEFENNRIGVALPRITSSSMYGRLSVTPESRQSIRRSVSCVYGVLRDRQCPHFPCTAPDSYHTIGFRLEPEDTTWVSWKKKKKELSDVVRLSMENSTLLNSGTSRLRTERREEILKQEMKRRRIEQQKQKPPLWETNYGKPTPIRRIKYPVRLLPLDESL
ncbi:uncharacterized protein LOC127698905 [Mytilus californianus]|uniref:uncharacterized protein LOC127698905 n=1 Tax=Mytilus californianus TaxID=6549 RepID=UPI002246A27A|nr:uncharacterized protein LOC127698905 [Mytilus californianus]